MTYSIVALAPESCELMLWVGSGNAQASEVDLGLGRVREAIERQPGFDRLLDRLSGDLASAAAIVPERIA